MMDNAELAGLLETLCPMHVILDPTGHIRHAGSTIAKIRPDADVVGKRFLELFELTRPRAVSTMDALLANAGAKLHLKFREEPRTAFKGLIVPLPEGQGAVVNLSFGISVLDGIRDYALTSADFAPTDLTIELLYLVEAKSAAMEASRKLNLRLQGAKIAAEEQAYTDTLTGLKNRRALDHVLARLCQSRAPFALMHLDLDYFKSVNDTLGHAAGDHVLQAVSRIMVSETRDEDTVARVGGDEFVLVFQKAQNPARLEGIADRLIERLEVPIPFGGSSCRISASIGIVVSTGDSTDPAALVARADSALYAAKRAGRGCHRLYSPELEDAAAELTGPPPANAGERGAARPF